MIGKVIENDQKSKTGPFEQKDNLFKAMDFIITDMPSDFLTSKITFLMVWVICRHLSSPAIVI